MKITQETPTPTFVPVTVVLENYDEVMALYLAALMALSEGGARLTRGVRDAWAEVYPQLSPIALRLGLSR